MSRKLITDPREGEARGSPEHDDTGNDVTDDIACRDSGANFINCHTLSPHPYRGRERERERRVFLERRNLRMAINRANHDGRTKWPHVCGLLN